MYGKAIRKLVKMKRYFLFASQEISKSRCKISNRTFHKTKIYKTSEYEQRKSRFTEQHVEIKTCGNLYKRWKEEKKFWRVPDTDLTFNVPFVDTHNRINSPSVPVAMALHGAPGTHEDFSNLISHLYDQGVRVIAPSFPDFKVYKPGIFRHSSEERVQFLKDFLQAINISKLDLLICHSSSIYPGLILCLENKEPYIKSLAMLNPGVYSDIRTTKPHFLVSNMVKASEFSIFLKFLKYFGPFILKEIAKSPLRIENFMDPLLSATVMTYANFPKAKDQLLELSSKNFPLLFVFSENDKLIHKELSFNMAKLLGAQESDIYYINSAGVFSHIGKEKHNLKVMAFENGSHYVFWKYPELINRAVTEFLIKQSILK